MISAIRHRCQQYKDGLITSEELRAFVVVTMSEMEANEAEWEVFVFQMLNSPAWNEVAE